MNKFLVKVSILISIFCSLIILNSKSVIAADRPTITIVNPLRGPQLGLENADLLASLKSQWQYTKDASVSATWLWQYSALENNQLISLAKSEMQNQEHGIFLEIDKNTAEKSEIQYRGRNQWYHSDGLFLVSYDLYERHKIIDATFKKFHDTFGFNPTSVGAWWVGAESISYMKQKYGITAVLQCADQFNTDAYSIWGTPWSIPYLSRPDNAAVPATEYETSSKAVVMQWASRDPNRGYGDSVTHSTFSMQDYATKGYDLRYIQYLQDIFMKESGDQLVFGLEGGIIPEGYKDYGKQVAQTKQWEREGRLKIQTMNKYAGEFLEKKQILPPTRYFIAQDYENGDQAMWYNSPTYRVGIQKRDGKVYLVDVRDYQKTPPEDFNLVPNSQKLLRINTKATIDSVRFPSQEKQIAEAAGNLTIREEGLWVSLLDGDKNLATFGPTEFSINEVAFPLDEKYQHTIQLAYPQTQAWILLKFEKFTNEFKDWKQTMLASKWRILKTGFAAFILFGLFITALVLSKTGNKKLAAILPICVFAVGVAWVYPRLIESENVVLTSYEIEALTEIKNAHKKVVYLEPNQNLEYRAKMPFIFSKPYLAEKISKTKWQYQKRTEGIPFMPDIPQNTIILVPRYLGQEINPGEIQELSLEKIFDNGQIELYEKK